MATAYIHNEYFRRRLEDSSIYTFSNIDDAKTKVALHNTFLTSNSPTITYELQDSNQTLKVTLEFDSLIQQDSWKVSVDNLGTSNTAWFGSDIEWFKVEWLNEDGTVSSTTNF